MKHTDYSYQTYQHLNGRAAPPGVARAQSLQTFVVPAYTTGIYTWYKMRTFALSSTAAERSNVRDVSRAFLAILCGEPPETIIEVRSKILFGLRPSTISVAGEKMGVGGRQSTHGKQTPDFARLSSGQCYLALGSSTARDGNDPPLPNLSSGHTFCRDSHSLDSLSRPVDARNPQQAALQWPRQAINTTPVHHATRRQPRSWEAQGCCGCTCSSQIAIGRLSRRNEALRQAHHPSAGCGTLSGRAAANVLRVRRHAYRRGFPGRAGTGGQRLQRYRRVSPSIHVFGAGQQYANCSSSSTRRGAPQCTWYDIYDVIRSFWDRS